MREESQRAGNEPPPSRPCRPHLREPSGAAGAEVAAAGRAPALRSLPWRPPARPGPFVVVQLWEQLIGFPAPPRAAPVPGRPIRCAGAPGAALREVVTNARDLALGRRRARGRNKPGQQSVSRRTLGASGRRGEYRSPGLAEVGARRTKRRARPREPLRLNEEPRVTLSIKKVWQFLLCSLEEDNQKTGQTCWEEVQASCVKRLQGPNLKQQMTKVQNEKPQSQKRVVRSTCL
eukprot:XP_017449394.1 PREDICTED: microtubule cross-linking factor 1-like [Rattus norvegicus]